MKNRLDDVEPVSTVGLQLDAALATEVLNKNVMMQFQCKRNIGKVQVPLSDFSLKFPL